MGYRNLFLITVNASKRKIKYDDYMSLAKLKKLKFCGLIGLYLSQVKSLA